MGTIAEKLQKLLDTKDAIRAAIIAKGQTVSDSDTFASYAEKITAIETGVDTSDATAAAGDLLHGKTAYVNGQKISGTIQSLGAQTIQPGTADQTIEAGKYLSGIQTIAGDPNLVSGNIVSGVTIFGVAGTASSGSSATASSVVITNKSGAAVNVFYQSGNTWQNTSLANKGKLTVSTVVGAWFYAQDPQGDPLTFISLSGMQLVGTDTAVCAVTSATASASIDIV